MVDDLGASAELVRSGGAPSAGVPLTRGDDGASFSGFVPAAPGSYALEIVFDGVHDGGRLFLGRLVSDAFTVADGDTVSAVFSLPLDTVGRPSDDGDLDGDDFGNLDEILWGTNRTAADSDGDRVNDGADCDPADPAKTFQIAAGGSVRDCDADGVTRPDLPAGVAGMDCDDRDPAVNPGASDDCADTVDSDCNPATCPPAADTGPTIELLAPLAGGKLGCHGQISARLTDDGAVAQAWVVFVDDPLPTGERMIGMRQGGGDVWVSASPNGVSAASGFMQGRVPVEIRATDDRGNTSTERFELVMEHEPPVATWVAPATVGSRVAPFTVDISAVSGVATASIASIMLYAAPASGGGEYDTRSARPLGIVFGDSATFDVDPATFLEGEFLLYPVVTDMIGNALTPVTPTFVIPSSMVSAFFFCRGVPNDVRIPARVLDTSSPYYRRLKMSDIVGPSQVVATAMDATAQPTRIFGNGLHADGTVDLSGDATAAMWQLDFYGSGSQQLIQITWRIPGLSPNPLVMSTAAGSVPSLLPPVATLYDSDEAAAMFGAAPSCPALTGQGTIQYSGDGGAGRLQITADNEPWVGTATPPQMPLIQCLP